MRLLGVKVVDSILTAIALQLMSILDSITEHMHLCCDLPWKEGDQSTYGPAPLICIQDNPKTLCCSLFKKMFHWICMPQEHEVLVPSYF